MVIALTLAGLAVFLTFKTARALRWQCPACGSRTGVVRDDLWERCWQLACLRCAHTWEERQ